MNTKRRITLVLLLLGGLLLASAVLAAPDATTLDRHVIGGGGGPVGTGRYALEGTIGQPVVGGIHNDPYELGAGFWGGLGALSSPVSLVYLPVVVRSYTP